MILTILAIFVLLIIMLVVGILVFPIVVEAFFEGVENIEEFKRKRGKRK